MQYIKFFLMPLLIGFLSAFFNQKLLSQEFHHPLPPNPPTEEGYSPKSYEFLIPPSSTGTLYSHGNPTAMEQQMLEYINQARANPPAEGVRLVDNSDTDVQSAISYFGVNKNQVRSEFSGYPVRPPIAFNQYLIQAARRHSQDMATNQFQSHTGSDGSNPQTRMTGAGYVFSGSWSWGENVYAYSKSVFYGHAGFNIDWGVPDLGHRKAIMQYDRPIAQSFREIGIGIVSGGGRVGPLVITQNFAYSGNNFFLLGVVYNDKNNNNFYDLDEGISGVTITTSQGAYYAMTSTSGGYAIPLTSTTGTLQVTASGSGINETKTVQLNGTNVKVDFKSGGVTPPPPVGNIKSVITCDLNGDGRKDLIRIFNDGRMQYTTNLATWINISGTLSRDVACGDLDGNGIDDIIGMNTQGAIWYTLNRGTNWSNIPGSLKRIFISDMNGDGREDVIGLNDNDNIFVTYNLTTWSNIPGLLVEIKPGNFNTTRAGNEVAGLNSSGFIYYTTNMGTWTNVPGQLSRLFTGEINGDGRSDLLGLNARNEIYYSTNLLTWVNIPGNLVYITTGDLNGDRINDVVGYNIRNEIYYTTNLSRWINIPGQLTSLITGDFNGDGMDDIAGIGGDGAIYYTTNLRDWKVIN